jgi:hypothetical protein
MALVIRTLVFLTLASCLSNLDAPAPAAQLDREDFRCNVQPVLAARCAFPACHGTVRRPLSLYAPGRERYQVGWDRPTEPLTSYELDTNFGIASGFATPTATGEPWLLAKPLSPSAGGYYHRGSDLVATEDVFLTKADPGYQHLANWIAGETSPPSCTPTTEVGP